MSTRPRRRPFSTLAAALTVAASAVTLPIVGHAAERTSGAADDYEQVLDITFPTRADARFRDDYAAARGGGTRVHKSTDLIGEKHWPLYAVTDGWVCYINGIDGPEPRWGYSLSICDDQGHRFAYLHVNNDTPGTDDGAGGPQHAYAPGIEKGARVVRGQLVGWMGDSGNAENTVDHLHFEIHTDDVTDPYGDNRINPYRSLVSALARGDVADGTVTGADAMSRVRGPHRMATAVELSRTGFDSAATIVLAPARTPGEAIVAGPLADHLDAPVLTTDLDLLEPLVAEEIARLGATRAVLVGDFTRGVLDALAAAGIVETRSLVGDDVFATAALVADELWALQAEEVGPTARRRAVLAKGADPNPARSWPDSLMASYHGAALDAPVLLVDHDTMPATTLARLDGLDGVTVIGGTAAVGGDIVEVVRDQVADPDDVVRLSGADRYATALAVTDDLLERGHVAHGRVFVATGLNWPDAATAGATVAREAAPLVLVHGREDRQVATAAWLRRHRDRNDEVTAIGGPAAVSDEVLLASGRRLR